MKLPFKIVATFVTLILAFVTGYQIYWLISLYSRTENNVQNQMTEAMRTADHRELFQRIAIIHADSARQHGTIEGTVGLPENDSVQIKHKVITEDTTVTTTSQVENNNNSWYEQDSEVLEQMALYIQKGMHGPIDKMEPIHIDRYDSILGKELTQRYEIKTLHYTEIVALENDSVLIRSKMAPVISGKTPDSYDYIFDIDNKYAFRTHTETQNKIILRQMSGIAVASLIILALLIFSYIYLMRTILKQKTLEEIKRDFTNNMTHELKTPISVAYAANDVLLNYSSEKNESRRKDYLYIIKEQLQHLSGLVEQILSMSRDEQKEISLKIESINLRSLCRQLISEYRLKTEKPTEFTLAITDSFSINADRIHFYNILSNLIDNSLKYSGPSVHISISAKKENKKTIIEVIDNGNGIKKEQQERIFDKFYRVPTGNIHDIKGYGLGLYYIKRLIETHNGKITVISEYGKGSKFIIEWTL